MSKYCRKEDGVYKNAAGRIMQHERYSTRIYWSPQMLSDLKRLFPTTSNSECAAILGVSLRTVVRKAREIGLEKDSTWLQEVWNYNLQTASAVGKSLGYPGCFKKGNMIGYNTRFKKRNIIST